MSYEVNNYDDHGAAEQAAEARIRELEGYLHDQGLLGKDYFERITKAKALIEQYQRITGASSSYLLDAIEALEGK